MQKCLKTVFFLQASSGQLHWFPPYCFNSYANVTLLFTWFIILLIIVYQGVSLGFQSDSRKISFPLSLFQLWSFLAPKITMATAEMSNSAASKQSFTNHCRLPLGSTANNKGRLSFRVKAAAFCPYVEKKMPVRHILNTQHTDKLGRRSGICRRFVLWTLRYILCVSKNTV